MFGPGAGLQVLASLHCLGNETFLQECSHSPWNIDNNQLDCGHNKDAAVRCKGHTYEVRLVGGDDGTSGFVEVKHLGIWGRVCNQGFNYPDAKVSDRSVHSRYTGLPIAMRQSQVPQVELRNDSVCKRFRFCLCYHVPGSKRPDFNCSSSCR